MKFLIKTNIDCRPCMNYALQDTSRLHGVFDVYYFTEGNTLLPDILLETIDSISLDEAKIVEYLEKEVPEAFKYEIISLSDEDYKKLREKASRYEWDSL